jgi:hypothetical protein
MPFVRVNRSIREYVRRTDESTEFNNVRLNCKCHPFVVFGSFSHYPSFRRKFDYLDLNRKRPPPVPSLGYSMMMLMFRHSHTSHLQLAAHRVSFHYDASSHTKHNVTQVVFLGKDFVLLLLQPSSLHYLIELSSESFRSILLNA